MRRGASAPGVGGRAASLGLLVPWAAGGEKSPRGVLVGGGVCLAFPCRWRRGCGGRGGLYACADVSPVNVASIVSRRAALAGLWNLFKPYRGLEPFTGACQFCALRSYPSTAARHDLGFFAAVVVMLGL